MFILRLKYWSRIYLYLTHSAQLLFFPKMFCLFDPVFLFFVVVLFVVLALCKVSLSV